MYGPQRESSVGICPNILKVAFQSNYGLNPTVQKLKWHIYIYIYIYVGLHPACVFYKICICIISTVSQACNKKLNHMWSSSGKTKILWHVLATVDRQTPRDMFSVWSDPSLLRNNGKAAFSTRSVPRQQWEGRVSLWSVHGLYSSDVSRQWVSYGVSEVNDGRDAIRVGCSSKCQQK
jgi:hypothetical protein